MSLEEKIREIEEEIKRTPYNKATQHHIGKLKAKVARLKGEVEKRAALKSGGGTGYSVRKTGDATVVIVGFPSVGKSTLLNRLTDANSPVGSYDFTTLNVVPGIIDYKGAKIQILDVPGLIRGAASGRGRGKEVLAVVRSADLIIFLIDVFNLQQLKVLQDELYDTGIRCDTRPRAIKITKKETGGITLNATVKLKNIDERTIKEILKEYRMHNVDVIMREDATPDEFIDVIAGNRVYLPSLVVLNKIDLVKEDYLNEVGGTLKDCIPISADKGTNIERLKEEIFNRLNFIRVYMKPQGEKADMEEPMIVMKGTDVGGICRRLHRDFVEKFRYAQIWGKSVKFDGQRVGLDHVLMDEDVLSVILSK